MPIINNRPFIRRPCAAQLNCRNNYNSSMPMMDNMYNIWITPVPWIMPRCRSCRSCRSKGISATIPSSSPNRPRPQPASTIQDMNKLTIDNKWTNHLYSLYIQPRQLLNVLINPLVANEVSVRWKMKMKWILLLHFLHNHLVNAKRIANTRRCMYKHMRMPPWPNVGHINV